MAIDIDSLQIEIEATSNDAASKIEQLAVALSTLKSVAKGGAGLTSVTRQLQNFTVAANSVSSVGSKLSSAISALQSLKNIQASSGLTSAVNALNKLNGLNLASISTKKMREVSAALNSLASVNKASGFTSSINALKKIPTIVDELDDSKLEEFAATIQKVTAAIKPLSAELAPVAAGLNGINAAAGKASASSGFLGTGISNSTVRFGVFYAAFRQAASVMSDWVTESNAYVENLNLFSVTMGDAADSALEYAEAVQEAVGIDPSDWIRNQGMFKQITSGFGVVEDKANLMSKNLTQLGYDISSFYNISMEEAMLKLQSGIAGEIEPLRRLGYAIDVATLQQVAYEHGIKQSVNTMNQAQKSQLRYLAIMEQSGNVMGDLARTVQTPANAMRILHQEITQLGRALGNILIPILQKIIPWVRAFVEVLTEAAQAIANLFGFQLPEIDYSGLDGLTSGAESAESALGGAADAAKKLKDYTIGIDALNVISPDTGSGAGTGGIGGSGSDLGLDLPEYDFLQGLTGETNKLKESIKDILENIVAIGAGFASWKITRSVLKWFDDLKNGKFSKIDKLSAGIAIAITGFTLEAQGAYDIGYNGANISNILKTAIGSALGIVGTKIALTALGVGGPVAWSIGISAALVIGIISFSMGYNKKKVEEEINRRFGEIELTVEQAKELAEEAMSGPLYIELDMFVSAKDRANQSIENYLTSSEEFTQLVWRVSVGLEVDESTLTSSIDKMVSDAQATLDAQKESYLLAINIGFSDANIQSDMAQFVNRYFAESSGEMDRLGAELKDTMLSAMADGKLDQRELQAISDLQSEMNQIVSKLADAEYKAKLNNVVYEMGGDLSLESVKSVSEQLEAAAQERLDQLEETHLSVTSAIELKYSEDGNYDEYIAAVEDEMKTYFSNQASISSDAFQPLVQKINNAFSDELSGSEKVIGTSISDFVGETMKYFETDETGYLVDGSIQRFMISFRSAFSKGFEEVDMSPEARAALEETLTALEPTIEDLETISKECREAGVAVPQSVADGLHDAYALEALTGDLDAINYLMGEKFSTDPNFLDALEKSKNAGTFITGKIAEGLLNNTEIVNNANGTITLINDTIGNKTIELTPEMVELMENLGVDLSNGVLSGAETGMANNEKTWRDWAIWPWNWFKEENEINSPSKLFEGGGENIMQGLLNGMQGWDTDFKEVFKGIVNAGITLFNQFIDWVNSKMRFSWPELKIGGIKILDAGSIQLFTIPHIPMLATGGFVDEGQMFIARENGPELVGSIGNRTAVANNEQIVSGIASGVASANSEQNALLREQNELLRAILAKEGGVVLDGKQLKKSVDRASRSSGVTIMPGGVMG